jgi:hypothetical protein
MFTAELSTGTDEIEPDAASFEINTETVRIWQPTDKAPWYTTDLKPPPRVWNLLRVSASLPVGLMAMWRAASPDIPNTWLLMDGNKNAPAYDSNEEATSTLDFFMRGSNNALPMENRVYGATEHEHAGDTGETCIAPDVTALGNDALGGGAPPSEILAFDGGTGAALCHKHSFTTEAEHLPPYKQPHFFERARDRLVLCVWNDALEHYEGLLIASSAASASQSESEAAAAAEEPGAEAAAGDGPAVAPPAGAGGLEIGPGGGVFILG